MNSASGDGHRDDELIASVERAFGPRAAQDVRDSHDLTAPQRELDAGQSALLHTVLDPVLADIRAAGAVLPVIEERAWAGEEVVSAYLWGSAGMGIQVAPEQPPADQLAWLADQIQEWEVEELAAAGRPATWPECPHHPGTHPLAALVRDGVAVWQCPRSGTVAFRIGTAV